MTTLTTARWWHGLGQAMRRGDPENGGLLFTLVDVLGRRLAPVDELVSDRPGYPGWSLAGDLNRTPYVAWLGQFVGVSYRGDLTDAENRQRIRDRPESARGTPSYIRAVAREHLIGGKHVEIYERYGGHHRHLLIRVYAQELATGVTADRVEAALQRAIPWRFKLVFEVVYGWSLQQLYDQRPGATLQDIANEFPTLVDIAYHQSEV